MKTLLYVVAALLLLLVVVQHFRGDAAAEPLRLVMVAVMMSALGWIAGRGARFFASLSS